MKKTLTMMLLLASFTAFAGTNKDTGEVCQGSTCDNGDGSTSGGNVFSPTNKSLSKSNSKSVSNSSARSNAISKNTNRNNNNSSANGGNSNVVSNTNTTINEAEIPDDVTIRQAPPVSAPDIQPTAGCRKPVSAGVSALAGGISFGTTFLDETCVRFEIIRMGLTGNTTSQNLANQLIQQELQKELAKDKEEKSPVAQSYAFPNY